MSSRSKYCASSEHRAQQIPHRARHLMLSHRLARKLLTAHREWLTSSKPNSRIPASRAHPTTPDGPPLVPRLTAARACGENRAVRALDLMRRYIELARAGDWDR